MSAQEARQLPELISVDGVHIRGVPDDWTHHRLVFSNPGTEGDAISSGAYEQWLKIVNDPHYIIQQLKRGLPAQGPFADDVARIQEMGLPRQTVGTGAEVERGHIVAPPIIVLKPMPVKTKTIKKDWNVSFGTATAPSYASYPAKWSFSTAAASCANDFVIFPTGQAGSSSRASIIAYYNLYSGCTSTVPAVDWAYNTGGTIALAPVLSLSGSQLAFVQVSGTTASLVLLTFPATPPGTGTLTSPTAPTSKTPATYPGCTAPCMTSITFNGSPNDTTSSPFYDYSTDSLYVGASNGTLHKFHPVFNGTPAEVVGSGWPLTLNSATSPASPVYDVTTGCVFVADTGGYLYSVNSGNVGSLCTSTTASKRGTSSQLDVTFGIRDAPLVDSTAGKVYVFAGNDSSGNNGVFQFATSFTSGSGTEKTVGTGGTGTTTYQLDGTFDNTYYQSATPSSPSGYIYMCGTSYPATLYQIPITSNTMGTVVTGPTIGTSGGTSYYGRCSPITEFFNTSNPTYATGTLSVVGTPSSSWVGVQVTVAGITYTFETTLSAVNQVLLYTSGSNSTVKRTNTAKNLEAVINANSSQCTGGSGCLYSGQTANPRVTATQSGTTVTVTAKTVGTAGDFTLSTTNSSDVSVSGGSNGQDGHDYIFLSVFAGSQTGCTAANYNGCVMSFDVSQPSTFSTTVTPGGTLNVSTQNLYVPTGGLIIDNGVGSPAGSSEIYFETLYTSGTSPCSSGICGVQATQAAP